MAPNHLRSANEIANRVVQMVCKTFIHGSIPIAASNEPRGSAHITLKHDLSAGRPS
jgi:hypothetical protein